MKKKGGNSKRVKRQNESLIKEMIYKNRLITRTEIADRLALTLPTVTTAVNRMLEEGILVEKPLQNWSGELGRKPVALDFQEKQMYFIGIELKPYDTALSILDLTGKVVIQEKFDVAPDEYSKMKQTILRYMEETIRKSGIERNAVKGVGIGMPGIIQNELGYIYRNMHKDWQGKYFAEDISKQFGIETLIENNVRMRAVAMELTGGETELRQVPENFAYFFVSAGIACPLVIKNTVYAGYQAGAGELGHTVVIPDGPVCEVCGNRGCLETIAGERVVLKEYRKILQERTGKDFPNVTIKEVLEDYRRNDGQIRELLNSSVKYLASALANTINYVSPQRVYIDSYMFQEEELRQAIIEVARFNLYSNEKCELVFVPYDPFGGAKAAAFFAIKHLFIQ